MKGFVNIDDHDHKGVDLVADVTKGIPFSDGEVDEIYAGHFMEHIPSNQTKEILAEFMRILKPRGKLTIVVPDIRRACGMFIRGEINMPTLYERIILGYPGDGEENAVLLGLPQMNPPHRNIYDPDKLFETVINAGFVGVVPVKIETNPYLVARVMFQCGVEARKPGK